MKLSTPIYHLKRKARQLARAQAIPLHAALDRIATEEGYSGWSLLAAKYAAPFSRHQALQQATSRRPGAGRGTPGTRQDAHGARTGR